MINQYWSRGLIVLGCLGLLACGSVDEQDVHAVGGPGKLQGPVELSEVFSALSSGGGVELSTNSIKGTVRYTNQNPEILAMLATDPWRSGSVSAYSTAPSGYSASTSSVTFVNPSEYTFEILVEAGAGGAAGVNYTIQANRTPGYSAGQWTASGVNVKKKNVQPDPTQVLMEKCLVLQQ